VVFFQCFSSVRSVNPRLYIKKDCSWRQGRLEYQSERLSASLCSWKIVEVAEAPLICSISDLRPAIPRFAPICKELREHLCAECVRANACTTRL
jgi:hypothetical protein